VCSVQLEFFWNIFDPSWLNLQIHRANCEIRYQVSCRERDERWGRRSYSFSISFRMHGQVQLCLDLLNILNSLHSLKTAILEDLAMILWCRKAELPQLPMSPFSDFTSLPSIGAFSPHIPANIIPKRNHKMKKMQPKNLHLTNKMKKQTTKNPQKL
jgi:hypothetical protein